MTVEEIFKKVQRSIFETSGFSQNEISLTDDLELDLQLGSLDKFNLFDDLETVFSITMPDNCMEEIKTVEQLVNTIYELTNN